MKTLHFVLLQYTEAVFLIHFRKDIIVGASAISMLEAVSCVYVYIIAGNNASECKCCDYFFRFGKYTCCSWWNDFYIEIVLCYDFTFSAIICEIIFFEGPRKRGVKILNENVPIVLIPTITYCMQGSLD